MKIITWNVNGIRSIIGKGFGGFVKEEKPDVLCLQEVKAHPSQVELPISGYHEYWNDAEKKGYAGTALFSRVEPLTVTNGIGLPKHDKEGRVITAEFSKYFVVTVYTPNSQRELVRLKYRMEWDGDFLTYLKKLEKKKPVIFCGDLNVAHTEIDLANPKSNRRNAGFTDEERADFTTILDAGFVDTFRAKHPGEPGHYSWWTYRFNARKKNIGWRIDYVCVSQALAKQVKDAFILPDVTGSDHCPVGITLK